MAKKMYVVITSNLMSSFKSNILTLGDDVNEYKTVIFLKLFVVLFCVLPCNCEYMLILTKEKFICDKNINVIMKKSSPKWKIIYVLKT